MLVSQHVHLVLDGYRQSQELITEVGGAEQGDPLGVGDLVAGNGGLAGHLDGVIVELLEWNGVEIVGIPGVI